MADRPVKVTVSDPDSGEVLGEAVVEDNCVLVCAGSAHVTSTNVYPGSGTHQLTIKGVRSS